MKILFVINEIALSECVGAMTLIAICQTQGIKVGLVVLQRQKIESMLPKFAPDVVCYSAMTADIPNFRRADAVVKEWIAARNKPVLRIMGGAHPTFFPEVLPEMALDAICIGEGDQAILAVLNALENGGNLTGIPNILCPGQSLSNIPRELITDLDSLPFMDRDLYFAAAPHFRYLTIRGLMVGRGCPYDCSYCHNHMINKFFRGCGPILRRRSVEHVLAEIKYLIKNYGPVRQIRFGDDVFAYKVDDWLQEFHDRYPQEIGLPFYCMMRSNIVNEAIMQILAESGCISMAMSFECGNERIRNQILQRDISDEVTLSSFALARKYKIKVHTNAMIGIPGSSFDNDMETFRFGKKLQAALTTFSILIPYPKTAITEYASQQGLLASDHDFYRHGREYSAFTCYSQQVKEQQLNIVHLGPIFSYLPNFFLPLFRRLLRFKSNRLFSILGTTYILVRYYLYIFPKAVPFHPLLLYKMLRDSLHYLQPRK